MERREQIANEAKAEGLKVVAKRHELSVDTVRRYCNDLDIVWKDKGAKVLQRMTYSPFEILRIYLQEPKIAQTEIGRRLNVTKQYVSTVIKNAERCGFIKGELARKED